MAKRVLISISVHFEEHKDKQSNGLMRAQKATTTRRGDSSNGLGFPRMCSGDAGWPPPPLPSFLEAGERALASVPFLLH